MRGAAWILFVLATLIVIAVVLVPAISIIFEFSTGEAARGFGADLGEAFARSAGWSAAVALGALVVGWFPARILAGLIETRAFVLVATLYLIPICLPPYVFFWLWWQAWPPDSWIFEWAVLHRQVGLLREVTLWAGLVCWAWPIVAWCAAGGMALAGAAEDEMLSVDGASAFRRFRTRARRAAGGLLLGTVVVFIVTFSETTAFDLAQVKTLGYEIRAIDSTGGSHREVFITAAPALAIAAFALVAVAALLVASRDRLELEFRPAARAGKTAVTAGAIIWLLSVAVPFALLAARPWNFESIGMVIQGYGRAARNTIATAAVAGAIAALLALAMGLALTDRRLWLRRLVAIFGLALAFAAIVPAIIDAAAIEAAYNHTALDVLYRSPAIMVLAYLARFGIIGILLGAWAAGSEPDNLRALRELEGAVTTRGQLTAGWPRWLAACLASFAIVTVLSIGEVMVTSRLQPPGFDAVAGILLNNMHYQRDEMVALMSLILFASAVAASLVVIIALRATRQGRTTALLVAAILGASSILSGCEDSDGSAPAPLEPIAVFGAPGRSTGQFDYVRAIAADDARDRLYLIDRTGRLQVFSIDGEPLESWWMPAYDNGYPVGLSVAEDGRVYVADTHEHCVTILSSDGGVDSAFGEYGEGPGQFIYPTDVAFGPDGRIYVAEYGGNDRIQVFDADGRYLFQFGEFGTAEGQFNRPQSIEFSADRRELFVADACNHRVQVFDAEGRHLRTFGSIGTDPGQFRYPYGLKLLEDGSVLITEFGNNRIQVLSEAGEPILLRGKPGTRPGELASPWASAAADGLVFVLDSRNNRVQVIRSPAEDR